VRVRIHWPRLRCMVSSMGVYRRSMPTLTRTRDCGSRLAERLAQPLSRRRALLAREEVETRLNRVPCHHGIFVRVQSCTAVEPFMSITNKAGLLTCRSPAFFPFALHSILHAMLNHLCAFSIAAQYSKSSSRSKTTHLCHLVNE